jgi:alanine racemase
MNERPRAWIDIDLGALVRNAATMAARAGVPILPMVKADGYGLGAVAVARALGPLRPWGYGVATVEEGVELRRAGIDRPILVFTPLLTAEVAPARDARLTPLLGSGPIIAAWGAAAGNAPWHLAIDTGMGRSGVQWDEVGSLRDLLRAAPPAGACSHFHSADRDDDTAAQQIGRFTSALDAMPARPAILHVENSAAIERLERPSAWTFVRPGVFLYGVASRVAPAGAGASRIPVLVSEPVASVHGRIAELRTIGAGETVSYGGTYTARAPVRIATVPVGYGDGYRRAFGNVGAGLLRGHRVPVVGMVTMDMTLLDVTGVACETGDIVTLLGRAAAAQPDTRQHMRPDTRPPANPDTAPAESRRVVDLVVAARDAGLSPYELLTGLRLRLPRVYVDDAHWVDSRP